MSRGYNCMTLTFYGNSFWANDLCCMHRRWMLHAFLKKEFCEVCSCYKTYFIISKKDGPLFRLGWVFVYFSIQHIIAACCLGETTMSSDEIPRWFPFGNNRFLNILILSGGNPLISFHQEYIRDTRCSLQLFHQSPPNLIIVLLWTWCRCCVVSVKIKARKHWRGKYLICETCVCLHKCSGGV